MALLQLNTQPEEEDLRTFGRWLPAFLLLLCGVTYWRTESWKVVAWIAAVGSVYAVLFLVFKALRRRLYLGWLYLTYPIGWTISHTVLLLVYLFVLTPIGLLLRAMGRDPLRRTLDRSTDTYWEHAQTEENKERYFQQF